MEVKIHTLVNLAEQKAQCKDKTQLSTLSDSYAPIMLLLPKEASPNVHGDIHQTITNHSLSERVHSDSESHVQIYLQAYGH